jgi:hypothetical protein
METAKIRWGGWTIACCGLLASPAMAQTDEIQVYTGELAAPGQFTLTLHNNYTFNGRKVADFPGGIVPDHALNGVPEWAYGVNDWFEAGLYLPVYTVTRDGVLKFDSAKLRALFAVPNAGEREFFYGVNFELSYNEPHWELTRFSGEIRPIIGWRSGPVDIIVNPILDTDFKSLGHLDFAPAERVDYNFSTAWAVAIEHYADFGQVRHFASGNDQQHTLFAVVDYTGAPVNVEFGLGHGLTGASDRFVMKLMLEWALNQAP